MIKDINEIYEEVAKEFDLDVEVIKSIYELSWESIRQKIISFPLKGKVSKGDLKDYRMSFNLPSLGKLFTTEERVLNIKERTKYIKNYVREIKDKEGNSNV